MYFLFVCFFFFSCCHSSSYCHSSLFLSFLVFLSFFIILSFFFFLSIFMFVLFYPFNISFSFRPFFFLLRSVSFYKHYSFVSCFLASSFERHYFQIPSSNLPFSTCFLVYFLLFLSLFLVFVVFEKIVQVGVATEHFLAPVSKNVTS